MKSPWVFYKFYYIRVMTFEVMNQEKIRVVYYILDILPIQIDTYLHGNGD
jgi:hypothetical protein